jgi:hypothetical protein
VNLVTRQGHAKAGTSAPRPASPAREPAAGAPASSALRLRLVTDGQHQDVTALAEGLRGHGYDIPPLPHDDGRWPHDFDGRAHLVLYRLARPPGVTRSAAGDGSAAVQPTTSAAVYLVDHAGRSFALLSP